MSARVPGNIGAPTHGHPQVRFHPFVRASDNRFETTCLVVLLYSYVTSLIVDGSTRGTSVGVNVSVELLRLGVFAYFAWRTARSWFRRGRAFTAAVAVSMEPFLRPSDAELNL